MTKKHLVIVESPAKAKTIEKYLGKDYSVKSSFGHIRDLPKKGLNIDIEHSFTPTYVVSPDKAKIVADLKASAKSSLDVWLASDEDREGEAIAWHLCKALGLSPEKTKRIVFHEITQTAIQHAIENPRVIDLKLVDAQQARRVLDRLVGYELSPVLWRKIRPGLSAGRVQSVAVRLIVEREREIRDFKPESSYKVSASFKVKQATQDLLAELAGKLKTKDTASKFLEAAKNSVFTVEDISQKPGVRSPGPPFITSTLQQEAARKLGYSVRQTMTLAQRLYENGHISYMRTDSTILAQDTLSNARSYILKTYGDSYYKQRQFKTKDRAAQEAHEAIRPTNFSHLEAGDDQQQIKLYQLIWRRTIASQMSEAKIQRTEVTIGMSKRKEKLIASGELLQFDGFMKVYGGTKDDTLLPPIEIGEKLSLNSMVATEYFSRPPARYSEAMLVRKLEELGIGRPSTYAPTISTIQTRGYVIKSDVVGTEHDFQQLTLEKGKVIQATVHESAKVDSGKLVPDPVAEVTNDFLTKYFPRIVDYDFTAHVEEDFDHIAEGEMKWVTMISDFYDRFHPLVSKSEKVPREEVSQARHLGIDPKTKKPIVARFGRFGPMLQRGSAEDEQKPDFAPMPEGVSLEEVTFQQALKMFELPRTVGKTKAGEQITANIGRFGPYIQVGKTFVSIKPLDPQSITESEAQKLYEEKLNKEANRVIQDFDGKLKILNGPYGPYITDGKKNTPVPKDEDPKKLTKVSAAKILQAAPIKKGGRRRRVAFSSRAKS
jgi:DNA topoisomerase I